MDGGSLSRDSLGEWDSLEIQTPRILGLWSGIGGRHLVWGSFALLPNIVDTRNFTAVNAFLLVFRVFCLFWYRNEKRYSSITRSI